jgi:hypothetical protein
LNHMLTLRSPSETLGMRVDTQSTKGAVVLTTLMILPSSAMEQEPPPLRGIPTVITPLRGILVMGLTKQSERWRVLDDFNTRWGNIVHPSTHRLT